MMSSCAAGVLRQSISAYQFLLIQGTTFLCQDQVITFTETQILIYFCNNLIQGRVLLHFLRKFAKNLYRGYMRCSPPLCASMCQGVTSSSFILSKFKFDQFIEIIFQISYGVSLFVKKLNLKTF